MNTVQQKSILNKRRELRYALTEFRDVQVAYCNRGTHTETGVVFRYLSHLWKALKVFCFDRQPSPLSKHDYELGLQIPKKHGRSTFFVSTPVILIYQPLTAT
jgi:hypothetical protein